MLPALGGQGKLARHIAQKKMYNDIQKTLKELTATLSEELRGVLRSIILYGSVARNQAAEDSDIDIMVVMPDNMGAYRKLSAISYDIDLKNSTVTSAIPFTPEELNTLVNDGSPFIEDVLTEGVILYDDGTFQELRTKMLGVSGCNS